MIPPRRRTLVIGIETITRELHGYTLLAHHAVQRGWDVVLASRTKALASAGLIRDGVLLQNSGERGARYPAKPDAFPGLRYVHYHQETLTPRSDEELLSRYADDLSFVDLTLLFGPTQRDLLLERHPAPGKQVLAVGSPRFDMLDAQWRSALRHIARPRGTFPGDDFVIVNTNFHAFNQHRRHTRSFEARYAARGGAAWTLERLRARRAGYERLYSAYLAFVRSLAGRLQDRRVVVRPHPSEDHESSREQLGDLANVTVAHRFAAVEWIERAQATVSTGCTTGIEGRFLGLPSFRFNPFDGEIDEPPLPNTMTRPVADVDDFVAALKERKPGTRVELTDVERDRLRPHLVNADGPLACGRMLDAFDALNVSPPATDTFGTIRRTFRRTAREWASRADSALRQRVRPYANARAHGDSHQKFPRLAVGDVEPVLREFERLGGTEPAEVVQLAGNTVGIRAAH